MSEVLDAPPAAEAATTLGTTTYRALLPGDAFPWLIGACGDKARFGFDTFAGRYQVFAFFLTAQDEAGRAALETVWRRRALFDDRHASFFGVTVSPADREALRNHEPGLRFALDFDLAMSRACGAAPEATAPGAPIAGRRLWIVVDPSLHVLRVVPFGPSAAAEVLDFVAALPPPDRFGGLSRPAPVLILPQVFEPGLRRALIAEYERRGGHESGVHRDGQGVLDAGFKRRKDVTLEPGGALHQATNARIARRVLPEIEKLFFMRAGYIERHIVGCYAAEDGGHFGPHRDNRQGATQHRRFAVSINLNDDFEGGAVSFPEYSTQGYKAPAGWCVVFPCAALHAVAPVTRGARYAFLPFVYDEGGRALRDAQAAGGG